MSVVNIKVLTIKYYKNNFNFNRNLFCETLLNHLGKEIKKLNLVLIDRIFLKLYFASFFSNYFKLFLNKTQAKICIVHQDIQFLEK